MTKNLKGLAEEQISNMQNAYAGKIPPEFWLSLERNFEFFAESVIKSTLQEVEELIRDCSDCKDDGVLEAVKVHLSHLKDKR